jgi:hypothetical protein
MYQINSLWRHVAAFGRDTSGNATMEFVTVFPFLLYMIFMMGEIGVYMARNVMLNRGLDIAIRDLRLGLTPGVTHDDFKTKICEGAFLLSGCESAILLELAALPDAASFPAGEANCVDRTEEIEPTINFVPGAPSEIMFVRACLVVDPLFPGTGLGAMMPKDASGGYAIIAQTAFMNEPN